MNIYFPKINPILFSVNLIYISCYGIMYFFVCMLSIWFTNKYIKKRHMYWNKKKIKKLIYNSFIGAYIGGRLGYMILYNHECIMQNVSCIFNILEGGMSFYGGLIGVIITTIFFSKKTKKNFFEISDLLAKIAPISLGVGKIGNCINNTLYDIITQYSSISMLSTHSKLSYLKFILKHQQYTPLFMQYIHLTKQPLLIYEYFIEGILLFIIMKKFTQKIQLPGITSSLFLIIYAILKLFSEFFQAPNIRIILLWETVNINQLLSFIMLLIGTFTIIILKKQR